MTPAALIAKKRDGGELSPGEIADFIDGFAQGEIPDYQMSALAMAVYFRGMTREETAALTRAMLESGVSLNWNEGGGVVDKHSTGGVGDKVSLVLAPLLACSGLRVPMISGRGLGPTGGTLDKLESIPGFRTDLSLDEIYAAVDEVGCVITGASAEIAPADRKLYALRDVTGTVPSIPLITASIMSKKLAEGLEALVLDVKWGSGAFMKSLEDARSLARSLVDVGKSMDVTTVALISDMNQPLGRTAGNALEVNESLAALEGEGPADLMKLALSLGAELLLATGRAGDPAAAENELQGHLDSGRALAKFQEMVARQGGDLEAERPVAASWEVVSPRGGYVAKVDTERIGLAVIELGGGRRRLDDAIDHAVGIEMLVRIGDAVDAGDSLLRVYGGERRFDEAWKSALAAIEIGEEPTESPPLIVDRLD